MASNLFRFFMWMSLSDVIESLAEHLSLAAAGKTVSIDALRSLAVRCGSLVSKSAKGGAALFAQSLLLNIVSWMDGEAMDQNASDAILKIVASLARLLRTADHSAALAEVAASWVAFKRPELLN